MSKFTELLRRRIWRGHLADWASELYDGIIPNHRQRRMEREWSRDNTWPNIVEDGGEVEPGLNVYVAGPAEDNPLPGYPKPSIKSGVRPLPEPYVENPQPPSGVANLSHLVKLADGLKAEKDKQDNEKGLTKDKKD